MNLACRCGGRRVALRTIRGVVPYRCQRCGDVRTKPATRGKPLTVKRSA